MSAMTAMPTHADPHAFFPVRYIGPHRIYAAHHLVAGHPRILDAGEGTGHGKHVAVADTAGLHLDAHLARFRFRDIVLDDFETGIWSGNLYGFHSRNGNILFRVPGSCYRLRNGFIPFCACDNMPGRVELRANARI